MDLSRAHGLLGEASAALLKEPAGTHSHGVASCTQPRGVHVLHWPREISNFIRLLSESLLGPRAGWQDGGARVHTGFPSQSPQAQYQCPQVLELVPQLEELCGGEQDGVEGVDHGRGKLEVLFSE